MKTCPRCAEDVKTAALVCRFCGHEFGDAPTYTTAEAVSDDETEGYECAACGADVTDKDEICPKCGRVLGEAAPTPTRDVEVLDGEVTNLKASRLAGIAPVWGKG